MVYHSPILRWDPEFITRTEELQFQYPTPGPSLSRRQSAQGHALYYFHLWSPIFSFEPGHQSVPRSLPVCVSFEPEASSRYTVLLPEPRWNLESIRIMGESTTAHHTMSKHHHRHDPHKFQQMWIGQPLYKVSPFSIFPCML